MIAPRENPKQLWGSMVPFTAAVCPIGEIAVGALLLTGLGKQMAMYPVEAVSTADILTQLTTKSMPS